MGLIQLLALAAIGLTLASAATSRVPLWTGLFVLCIVVLMLVWK